MNRIDVHQHVLPPFWVEESRQKNRDPSGFRPPAWSPESAIAFMDSQKISSGILSLTSPGVIGWSRDERRDAARRVNDYTADLVAKRPDRFGNFATLPLPDLDGTLEEISYAFGMLNVDGVVLFSNYEDRYLGHPSFDPVWAELNRREAVILLHPGILAFKQIEGILPPFVDYPFDTTRSAVDIVIKGVLNRYQNVKIILPHAGGFVPYAVYRFALLTSGYIPGAPDTDTVLAMFRKFYFDTALSSSPTAIPSLTAFADPTHILFGSDFPYAPGLAETFTAMLDDDKTLSAAQHAAINQGNAALLFPRLNK